MSETETFTDHNGLVWHHGGPATDDHLAFGGHEPGLVAITKGMLPKGGTFLDVGAHVGLYTLNLADKAGVVIAIEANPETFKVLQSNVQANAAKFPKTLFSVENFAAWDRFEELRLIDENDKETGGSTRVTPEVEDDEAPLSWTADGAPLDVMLNGHPKIDLIKIDVEGAEARVLKGLRGRLVNDRPTLMIEMHDMYFGESVRIDTLAILEALGYAWNDELTFGGSYYVVATPDETDEFVIETVRAGQ